MKKFLLSLAVAALSAGTAIADSTTFTWKYDKSKVTVPSGQVTSGTITLNGTEQPTDDATATATDKNITFNVTSDQAIPISKYGNTPKGISFGGKANSTGYYASSVTLTCTDFKGKTISNISFGAKFNTKNAENGVTVRIDGQTVVAQTISTTTLATISLPEGSSYACNEEISIEYTIKAKNAIAYFAEPVSIVYSDAPVSTEPVDYTFDWADVALEVGQSKTLELGNHPEITFTNSNENVATITADGVINALAEGTAEIAGSWDASDKWNAGTCSFKINVTKPDPNVPVEIYSSAMGSDFTIDNGTTNTYPWTHDKNYGLKGTGYLSNKNNACTGVAYVALDLTGKDKVTLNYEQAQNKYMNDGASIEVTDIPQYCEIVVREQGVEEWTKVANSSATGAQGWDFAAATPVDLSDYAGKKIEFGFKYISTDATAGTWEIKNISVTATTKDDSTSIGAVEAVEGVAEWFDLQGRRVAAPAHGIFIRRCGNSVSKVRL